MTSISRSCSGRVSNGWTGRGVPEEEPRRANGCTHAPGRALGPPSQLDWLEGRRNLTNSKKAAN